MLDYTFDLRSFELFLLVLVRIASFAHAAPFFGMSNTPRKVKVGLSVFISLLTYNMAGLDYIEYEDMLEYTVIVLKEAVTGLTIGFAAHICTTIVFFAGNIIDMEIGLSMATMFDPTTRIQGTITGNMYNYFIMMLLIISNMHLYILRAIIDTYKVIPVNGQNFKWDHLMNAMLNYMLQYVQIGFRIVLPVFVCIMILNCVLGIMAKVSPQMNMFSIGMQLKILVGMTVLYIVVDLFPGVADFIFNEMKTVMADMVRGLY